MFEQEFIALSKHNNVRVVCVGTLAQARLVLALEGESVVSSDAAPRKVWGPTHDGTLREIGIFAGGAFAPVQRETVKGTTPGVSVEVMAATPSLPGAVRGPFDAEAFSAPMAPSEDASPKRKEADLSLDVGVPAVPTETAVQRARRLRARREEDERLVRARERLRADQTLLDNIDKFFQSFSHPYKHQFSKKIYQRALSAAPSDAAQTEWLVENFQAPAIVRVFGSPEGSFGESNPFIEGSVALTLEHPTRGASQRSYCLRNTCWRCSSRRAASPSFSVAKA